MVAIDQNLLYIIIAAIVVIVLIVAFMLRRRRKGPKNINKLLAKEAAQKKIKIAERELESKALMSDSVLMKGQQEKINQLRENTSDLMHRILYFNRKIEEKTYTLDTQHEYIKNRKIFQNLEKKEQELNRKIKK